MSAPIDTGMPRLHLDMPIREYHSRDWWTRSRLDMAWSDPAKCYGLYVDHTRKAAPAGVDLAIGAEVDALVCGEESPCVRVPIQGENTNTYRAARDKSPSGLALTIGAAQVADICAEALRVHPWWRKHVLLSKAKRYFQPTVSWADRGTGLLLATRPDLVIGRWCIDVKTARGPNNGSLVPFRSWWGRQCVEHGYHRQAASQIEGLEQLTGQEFRHLQVVICKPDPANNRPVQVRFYWAAESGTRWSLHRGRQENSARRKRAVELLASPGTWAEPETHGPVELREQDIEQ